MTSKIYTEAERGRAADPARKRSSGPYEHHPIANAFPLMWGPALDRLAADIKEHGLREPIVLLDGKVLDGRNRQAACKLAGVGIKARTFGSQPGDGKDPLAFAVSENSARRDMNATQRAMAAAALATLKQGQRVETGKFAGLTDEQAAQRFGVSERSIRTAKTVLASDSDALIGCCKHEGGIAISKAAKIAERPDLDEIERVARKSGLPTYTERLLAALKDLKDGGEDDEPETTNGRGKPEWLMRALVRHYSRHGQIVCDPVAGYASTLAAARAVGRIAIGSEMDAEIAAAADDPDLRVGRWQDALADVGEVDAIICDPPYSARTHAAATTRADGSSSRGANRIEGIDESGDADGLTPTYGAWSPEDVSEFVSAWSPRCKGWMVALTDSELIPAWTEAYRAAGRYAFAPVPILIRGMSVRISGDGPSSWCVYAMVARPATAEFVAWGTLPGAYVGTKTKALEKWFDEEEVPDGD